MPETSFGYIYGSGSEKFQPRPIIGVRLGYPKSVGDELIRQAEQALKTSFQSTLESILIKGKPNVTQVWINNPLTRAGRTFEQLAELQRWRLDGIGGEIVRNSYSGTTEAAGYIVKFTNGESRVLLTTEVTTYPPTFLPLGTKVQIFAPAVKHFIPEGKQLAAYRESLTMIGEENREGEIVALDTNDAEGLAYAVAFDKVRFPVWLPRHLLRVPFEPIFSIGNPVLLNGTALEGGAVWVGTAVKDLWLGHVVAVDQSLKPYKVEFVQNGKTYSDWFRAEDAVLHTADEVSKTLKDAVFTASISFADVARNIEQFFGRFGIKPTTEESRAALDEEFAEYQTAVAIAAPNHSATSNPLNRRFISCDCKTNVLDEFGDLIFTATAAALRLGVSPDQLAAAVNNTLRKNGEKTDTTHVVKTSPATGLRKITRR